MIGYSGNPASDRLLVSAFLSSFLNLNQDPNDSDLRKNLDRRRGKRKFDVEFDLPRHFGHPFILVVDP